MTSADLAPEKFGCKRERLTFKYYKLGVFIMLKKSIVEKLHGFGFDKVHEKPITYSMNTPTRTLRDCYKTCSKAKWDAWNYCVSFCMDMGGRHLTVARCNSQCFTAEFVFYYQDAAYLARITRDHNHVTPIEEFC